MVSFDSNVFVYATDDTQCEDDAGAWPHWFADRQQTTQCLQMCHRIAKRTQLSA